MVEVVEIEGLTNKSSSSEDVCTEECLVGNDTEVSLVYVCEGSEREGGMETGRVQGGGGGEGGEGMEGEVKGGGGGEREGGGGEEGL